MPTPLDTVRTLALSLPGVTEEPHHQFGSFRVHGKIFLTVPPGGDHLHVFVPEAVRELALAMDPQCLEPLHWGAKVMGLRVHLPAADADVVGRLVEQAHAFKSGARPAARKPARPSS